MIPKLVLFRHKHHFEMPQNDKHSKKMIKGRTQAQKMHLGSSDRSLFKSR